MLTTAVAPVTIVGSPMLKRQARRPGTEDAGLVDQLEVRRDGPLGQVDRDVRQPDADEADVLAGQLARRGHDHHLGLAEKAAAPIITVLARSRPSRTAPSPAGATRPLGAELLDVRRPAVDAVDPLAQPGLESRPRRG